MKKKIIVDILMFILMLLEFSRNYMEPIYHEIFGIILLILVIIHLTLNMNYFKTLFKGNYNINRMIMLIINIGFFITFITSLILGVLSSQELLRFLNIGSLTIIKLHKILAYISLLFLGLHLGINFNAMFGKITKHKIIFYILEVIISIYGIYSFIKLDIIKHITGTYGFSMIEGNIIINILRYFSIIMLFAFIMYNTNKLMKKEK